MPKKWTGNLVGLMHDEKVSFSELAKELGVTNRYVSMVLNMWTTRQLHVKFQLVTELLMTVFWKIIIISWQ